MNYYLKESVDLIKECTGGRWQENEDCYYLEDILFDEYLSVNKKTRRIIYHGFTGVFSQWVVEGKINMKSNYA